MEEKINRLPLSYFDKQTRGELLSRVTNDIDNISQALAANAEPGAHLGAHGRRRHGDDVRRLARACAHRAGDDPGLDHWSLTFIGKRSQKLFIEQWKSTGELNGHIEEAFTGQSLVKVFGRQREVEAVFAERNQTLFTSSFGAPVHLRSDHARRCSSSGT